MRNREGTPRRQPRTIEEGDAEGIRRIERGPEVHPSEEMDTAQARRIEGVPPEETEEEEGESTL